MTATHHSPSWPARAPRAWPSGRRPGLLLPSLATLLACSSGTPEGSAAGAAGGNGTAGIEAAGAGGNGDAATGGRPASGAANGGGAALGGSAGAGSGDAAGGDRSNGGASAGGGDAPGGGPVDLGDDVVNARQVGGLEAAAGRRVRANVLVRSGELSAVDCERLQALGVATVLDLRDATDAGANPDADCVTELARYTLVDLPKILPPTADAYLATLDAIEPKLGAIFGELAREGALPAVIHCVIGRDRASLTMALVLLGLGVPAERVLDDFVHNQDTVGSTSADWMSRVLARVDEAGGAEAYLAAHGVDATLLAALRTQALD